MSLKRFGVGIILMLLLLTACGEKKESTAVAQNIPPIVNNPAGESPSTIIITSDTVEIEPGASVEIKTPTPQFESSPVFGSVYLKTMTMNIPEGSVIPEIRFQGSMPSPCHKLIIKVDPINRQNQIIIKVLASVNLKLACSKALQPFDQTIRLKNIPTGTYTVWVSGTKLGDFAIP